MSILFLIQAHLDSSLECYASAFLAVCLISCNLLSHALFLQSRDRCEFRYSNFSSCSICKQNTPYTFKFNW